MKTHAKTLIRISMVLAFVSLVWLGYNSSMYLEITKLFVRPKIYVNLMSIGLVIFFISHLVIILSTILRLKKLPGISLAGIILIVLGVISLIFLLFHFVALDQLEEDFQYKDPYSSMLKLAWTTQVVLFSFFLFSFIYFIILARFADKYITTKSVSREQIFVAMNIIGIVCGVVGILLFLLFSQVYNGVQLSIAYKFIPYCFVLLPYLLSLAGWGIRYFRDKRSGWYDEKQNSDINRSGMIALLVSLGVTISLAIFCFHKIPEVFGNIDIAGVVTVLLLPFYCFVVLFVFSVTALYKFKNN
jgi:hypothetical protein